MSKKSRRPNRRSRAPRAVRYSTTGEVRVTEYDDHREYQFTGETATHLGEFLAASAVEFEKKFGRPMQPDDYLLWDPDSDVPQPLDESKIIAMLSDVMREANLSPAYIYAWEKTGLLVTAENPTLMSETDIAEWDAAIDEYYETGGA